MILRLGKKRTEDIVRDVTPYLEPGEHILDVGAGTCEVAAALRQLGHKVVPVDVRDLSCVEGLDPLVYDGARLPFGANSFEVALLVNVLHHVREPIPLLREITRVARRIVIHEDIFHTPAQRWLTELMDSLTNLEFVGHPHSNQDDEGWRRTFAQLGLKLLDARYKTFWRLFDNATYHVEQPSR